MASTIAMITAIYVVYLNMNKDSVYIPKKPFIKCICYLAA